MKKILFIDDNPSLLRSLKRGLHSIRAEWEMYFAASGDDALELLKETPVDIAVSDFQMPGMDGHELLAQIEFDYPQTIRIMLTGKPDKITYAQTVNICHYFFWKPLKIEGFKRLLQRIGNLDSIFDNQSLRSRLNALTLLPIHPESYSRLATRLDDPDCQTRQLTYIAGKDIGLTMQLFKLASSASYSLDAGINNLADAIDYLGIDTLRDLVATQYTLIAADQEICHEFKLDQLQLHSFRVARLAEAFIRKTEDQSLLSETLLSCQLFDVGRLVLAYCMPEQYRQVIHYSEEQQISFAVAERQLLGSDHAAVGAYLATLWGVPESVVDVIFQHNQKDLPSNPNASLVSKVVWHANRIAQGDCSLSSEQYRILSQDKKLNAFLESVHNETGVL
ncbi:MAG: HDOD domain-containing protein [Thermodesulfobacteriota bacterium]|nr:HDOD domain-containing protein [Thermodesulfobacteriota bacterium]